LGIVHVQPAATAVWGIPEVSHRLCVFGIARECLSDGSVKSFV
jgi:hypothetical protein